ncbi:hypothetical protein MVEN_00752200 [Mycena venus]|uniref:DUF6534 domain-containing protein n=1 Tax=Mycena venus TaxID=2733690 RepID=A0A8H7D307_9AGAR|nr:hypothetical protein MVEN_00752200 [Mycena venus]
MGEFDQTIGFTLMGVTVNTCLTGVIMSQFFTYWNSRYQDPWWIKLLVAFLFVVNATQAIAVVYMLWFYCVTNFANPHVVAVTLWPYAFTGLTTAVLAIINQIFQSWRIYTFTRSRIRVGFLVATSLAAFGTGLAAAIEAWIFHKLAKLVLLHPIAGVNLALQCAIDVIIAAVLTVVYSKSKTTFVRTDKVFDRLIRTAVQSGFFTAVFALGTLFSFQFSPDTFMFALFTFPIGRIYTHTMMDHFISREPLRDNLSNSENILSVPTFDARGEESSGAANGTVILLRNVSARTNTTKTKETV